MPEAWKAFPYLSALHRPEIPPSYLVFIDPADGLIKAKNGRTGVIDFQGADASTVIQAAINALNILPTHAGKIFVKEGTYTITISIVIPETLELTLEGELYKCKTPTFRLADGANCDVFKKTGVTTWAALHFLNFEIDGNRSHNTAGSGIYLDGDYGGWDVNLWRVHFLYCAEYGLYSERNCGIFVGGQTNADYCTLAGYYLNMGIIAYISDTFSNGCGIGFKAESIEDLLMRGCMFHQSVTGAGLNIQHGRGNVIGCNLQNNDGGVLWGSEVWLHDGNHTFLGNRIYSDPTKTKHNVWIDGTNNNIFLGNRLGGIIPAFNVKPLICKDNIGYVTENSVLSPAFAIAAVALVTVTIPHGLAITPAIEDCSLTVVEDTNVDDWGYNLVKVDNVGAVNVVAKVNVSVASATGGATAKLSLRVGKE